MDPHAPYLPPAALRAPVLPRQRVRPAQQLDGPGDGLQALLRLLRHLDAAGHQRQGLRDRPVRRRDRLHGRLHPDHLHRAGGAAASWTTRSWSSTPTTARRSTTTSAGSTTTASTTTTLHVPLIIRYPGKVPAGQARRRLQPAPGPGAHAAGAGRDRDATSTSTGESLMQMVRGEVASLRQRVLHHRVHLDAQARLAHAAVEADRGPGAGLPLQAGGRAVQPGRGPGREQQPGRDRTRTSSTCSRGGWRPGSPSARRRPACPTRSTTRATGTGTRASARSRPRSRPTTRCTSAIPRRPRSCRRNRENRRVGSTEVGSRGNSPPCSILLTPYSFSQKRSYNNGTKSRYRRDARHREHARARARGGSAVGPGRRLRRHQGTRGRRSGEVRRSRLLQPHDMLRNEDLDIVDVPRAATRTAAGTTSRRWRRWKPASTCWSKSRISNDVSEARQMVAKAAEKDLYLGCNLNHYFTPPAEKARAVHGRGQDRRTGLLPAQDGLPRRRV